MNSHSQKEQRKPVKEVKGLKRAFKRLFSGSKLDAELIETITSNDVNKIKNLIKKGANVNARDGVGNTCLMLACDFNNFETVSFLLSKKANVDSVNQFGYTALHFAVQKNDLRIVRLLINSEDSIVDKMINKKDDLGNTPLHLAVDSGNANIVDFLIKKGADKNIRNSEGERPLEMARKKQYLKIIEILSNTKKEL
jgi:uncharacterized protein